MTPRTTQGLCASLCEPPHGPMFHPRTPLTMLCTIPGPQVPLQGPMHHSVNHPMAPCTTPGPHVPPYRPPPEPPHGHMNQPMAPCTTLGPHVPPQDPPHGPKIHPPAQVAASFAPTQEQAPVRAHSSAPVPGQSFTVLYILLCGLPCTISHDDRD